MFSQQSPVKRKHSEYHDPDYPQEQTSGGHDAETNCSNGNVAKKQKVGDGEMDANFDESMNYVQRVKNIIEREFSRELSYKQEQLEVIDERLEKTKNLLDKLRYALVASYYKKQDLPLAAVDSTALKGAQTLFTREDKGPQMQIHPSLKKLIGKKPKDLSEVIRSCPKRTAAQNAVQTIRAKSEVQKREERKLKQIIRGQGIVIDHSIEKDTKTDISNLLSAAQRSKTVCPQTPPVSLRKSVVKTVKSSSKPLVGARLNNKSKHLIVVGNTSKYIGTELERESRYHSQILTHKWLVYVQAKDSQMPIERFVRKIRFHLHHSYRPNDVVDVQSPPFHVARRGWGEFPVRVQIYFHQEYHQKPVQLVHNVILDKTMSGIQTLGAETLLEVWLRNVTPREAPPKENTVMRDMPGDIAQPKLRTISQPEQLVDDNLLDFLNKIEATHCSISADIEKIQPTVVVSEPLTVKTPSPKKIESIQLLPTMSPSYASTGKGTQISSSEKYCSVNDLKTNHIQEAEDGKIMTTTKPLPGKIICYKKMKDDSQTLTRTIAVESHKQSTITVSGQFITQPSSPNMATLIESVSIPTAIAGKLDSSNSEIAAKTISPSNEVAVSKPHKTFVKLHQNSSFIKLVGTSCKNPATDSPRLHISSITSNAQTIPAKTSIIVNRDGKLIMPLSSVASAVKRTILPVIGTHVTNSFTTSISSTNSSKFVPVNSNSPKQILQKKLVQLVDASGKVKYMQMLVAASSASSTTSRNTDLFSSLVSKIVPGVAAGVTTNSITNTTQITKTTPTPALKFVNGTNPLITPAGLTMKPNIFKIVPENMQTKPQIVTFSTAMSTKTTTSTITSTTPIPVVTRTITVGSKHSNLTTNIQQKQNGGSLARNVVFQKEGKVYIIDPLQMKLKQQQKKQVSLLKPKVSLLKQQMQKQDTATLPKPVEHQFSSSSTGKNTAPQLHFGLKQQRLNSINALQLMQMKRVLFEKQCLKQQFTSMRYAIDFILRRLRLIVPKDSLASAYPFVTHSLAEFQALTAFKQRAFEWLRAKHVALLIRSHKDLQRLNNSNQETFWSTKEIAHFARHYAYTPHIKSLPKLVGNPEESCYDFKYLVKDELKQKPSTTCDTLTDYRNVEKWIEKIWPILMDHEQTEDQNQIIDVNTVSDISEAETRNDVKKRLSNLKLRSTSSSHDSYLSPPTKLENECSLVSEICRDLSVQIIPEELVPSVWHSSTQTVLAHCLNVFLQKLLRNTVALTHQENTTTSGPSLLVRPNDISKVLSNSAEYDFLINQSFGSNATAELMSSIKEEKS